MAGRDRRGRGEETGSRFSYHRRSTEEVDRRANQTAGNFDSYIRDDIPLFTPKTGDNNIRILPPPDNTYEHFGIDLFVHYSVGPDKQAYLCPMKMGVGPCPVCQEQEKASRELEDSKDASEKEEDYVRSLRPAKRVLMYLIDRDDEKKGPTAWASPWTIDRDITKRMKDKRTGELLFIDDPETGYDVEFERQGTGLKTQYIGMNISRDPSTLGRKADEWLEFIVENPLRDIAVVHDFERIEAAFHGTGAVKRGADKDDDKAERPAASRRGASRQEDEDEGKARVEPTSYTWDEIQKMTDLEMDTLIEGENLSETLTDEDYETSESLAAAVCKLLDVSKEEEPSRGRRNLDKKEEEPVSVRDRLRRAREGRS